MAEVVRLKPQEASRTALTDAVAGFLASADLAASTKGLYGGTLQALVDDLEHGIALERVGRATIERHLAGRYGQAAPATYNRNLAAFGSFFGWCVDHDLLVTSPTTKLRAKKLRRTKEAERQARPIPMTELEALWSDPALALRERTYWAMLYETAARASELLSLNIEDLDLANKEAVIIGKGGDAERISWASLTARFLPRVITRRSSGPLFIGDRRPGPARTPAEADLCPHTGRARLSYRQAEQLFANATTKGDGSHYTLHQLRHSRLTHLAEEGEEVAMIKAKSRHRSLRSLERYLNPSAEAVRAMTNKHDLNRRNR